MTPLRTITETPDLVLATYNLPATDVLIADASRCVAALMARDASRAIVARDVNGRDLASWTPAHVHTAACLGGNELDELTCVHLAGDHLRDAMTWHVPGVHRRAGTDGPAAVFTDNAADAAALATADGWTVCGTPALADPQPDNPYA